MLKILQAKKESKNVVKSSLKVGDVSRRTNGRSSTALPTQVRGGIIKDLEADFTLPVNKDIERNIQLEVSDADDDASIEIRPLEEFPKEAPNDEQKTARL